MPELGFFAPQQERSNRRSENTSKSEEVGRLSPWPQRLLRRLTHPSILLARSFAQSSIQGG